jgi:hypothetical protein
MPTETQSRIIEKRILGLPFGLLAMCVKKLFDRITAMAAFYFMDRDLSCVFAAHAWFCGAHVSRLEYETYMCLLHLPYNTSV